MDITWEQAQVNHARARALLDAAKVAPGDLVILPEMFDTGFSFNTPVTADTHARTLAFLRDAARRTGAVVQGGRTSPGSSRCHNVMSVLSPDSVDPVVEYAKIHLFGREADHLAPGHDVVTYPWPTSGLTITPAICYDLRFPEVFRAGLRAGAHAIALGACWPNVRKEHWRALSIARAIENQSFVFACNRVGRDPDSPAGPGLRYDGGSLILGPRGEIIAEAGADETVLSAEINPALVHEWRAAFPAWREA